MSPLSQTLPQPKSTSYSLAGTLAWFVVVGVSFVLLLAILAGPHFFGHHIKAGDVAEQDLVAPSKTMVVDEEKTQENRDVARHDVLPVLKRDTHKSDAIMKRVQLQFERMKHLLSDGVLPLPQPPVLSAAEQVFLLELPAKDYDQFVAALTSPNGSCPLSGSNAAAVFSKLRTLSAGAAGKSKAHPALSKDDFIAHLSSDRNKCQTVNSPPSKTDHKLLMLTALLKPDDATAFIADTDAAIQRLLANVSLHPYVDRSEWEMQVFEFLPEKIEPGIRHACASLLADELEANVSVDPAATEVKLKQAVAAVKPVMKEIDVGSIIVRKGDTVTADEVQTLESLGITTVSDPGLAAAITIALFAAFLLFGLYLHTYEPKLFFSPSALALMATLSIITSVVALLIGPQYPQFVPLSAATLIFAVTYGRRLTGILTVLILLFLSVSDLMTGPHLVAIGTAAGMALGASVKRRRDLMVTGILVGCMQMLGYSSAVLIGGTPAQTAGLGAELPFEMLGGLFSAIAAIGSLPFLENIFGILTPYRIAELAEPDQPLMRQLEENAPGTYQHSLAVANLAEGGARAIGANVNLVHTGAMYHDIGKMVTPRYFIENQLGDKNPHDFIPPEESRAKVLAHVTNGIALAQKYGLPKAVQAFIPEHQGTTVMAYFYHKACLRDGSENVDPLFYRYPGPKPQTRESAIVMLADVSEAVTHSMRDPTMEEVDTAISSVFKARWDDGQFNESGLTYEEMEKVRRGFVRVWRTLHHDRLKYPSTTTGKMPVVPTSPQGPGDGAPKADPAPAAEPSSVKTADPVESKQEPEGC
jgi:putative nucleotidyltransferase with HDIG domain